MTGRVAQHLGQRLAATEQDIQSIPSLPEILAEEAGLLLFLAEQVAVLEGVQCAVQAVQARWSAPEAASVRGSDAGAGLSEQGSPPTLGEAEPTASSSVVVPDVLDVSALVALLDQVSATHLAVDGANRRLESLPQLREIAIQSLGDVAQVAVDTAGERDWTYEYAAEMADVGPDDPDSALSERMTGREEAGKFDCDTFVVHCLEEAGYDLDAVIVVEGQETTVRRFVMIHAETIFREEFKLDEGAGLGQADRLRVLKDLLDEDDERMGGVAVALSLSGQGTEIGEMNALRPGDLVQYWRRERERTGGEGASGHAVVVHKVVTNRGTLDEKTPPFPEPVKVSGVQFLSAHANRGEKRDVFTKEPENLDGGTFYRWFGVRPSGSRWPLGSA